MSEFQIWSGPKTLTINGETHTVAQWARIGGIGYNTLYYRLRKGVLPEVAVFSGRYSSEVRIETGTVDLPVHKPRTKRRKPTSFQVTAYNRWGSVQSLTFRLAA